MGNKPRRKKRNLKKFYKIRGKNIHKSSLCSAPDSVTSKEICTQDVCVAATDTIEVDPSDCIENDEFVSLTNTEASAQGAACVASDMDKVFPSDCVQMEIPKESPSRPSFEGRRIINLINVYSKLQDISTHGPFDCNLKNVDIIYEKQVGLHSIYTLQCKICNVKFNISSDEGSEMDINNSAVLGTVAIGSAHELSFEEAVNKKKIPFFRKNKFGDISINTNHNWYYQIQGQLHITRKSKCLFGLWLGEKNSVKTELIQKDDKFWTEKMEKKLTRFYLDCILPELVDPRYPRKMAIRDPDYIQEEMKNKTNKNAGTKKKYEAEKKNEETNVPIEFDDVPINAIEEQKEQEDETNDKPTKTLNNKILINKTKKKEKETAKKNEETSVPVDSENVPNNDIEEQKDQEDQENDKPTKTQRKKIIINKRTKNTKETAKKKEEMIVPTSIDKVTNNYIEKRKDQQEDNENDKATKTLKKETIINKRTKHKKETAKKNEETNIPTGFDDVVPINYTDEKKEQEYEENLNSAKTMKRKSSENWNNDEVVKKPREILKVRQLKFDEF